MAAKDVLGRRGEDLAARFLEQQGLVVLSRNWRCRHGELDLVATDADQLVVCEVKTRSGTRFGEPAEAVTGRKAARIRRVTQAWLAAHQMRLGRGPVRRAGRAGRAGPAGHRAALPGGVLMGLARTWSVALLGVEGQVVEIEADVGGGLPRFQLVGLPDAALHEAKDRVRAAIANSGRTWPNERIVLALSPASLRKAGSGFDLALAVGHPGRERGGASSARWTARCCSASWPWTGGCARCAACCPACWPPGRPGCAGRWSRRRCWARPRWSTGSTCSGPAAWPRCWASCRRGAGWPGPARSPTTDGPAPPDLADVVGQQDARQALEIAAAGGHHLLLVGPPGTGKTMLAQRFVGLLPRLDRGRGARAGRDPVGGRAAAGRPGR